MRFFGHFCRYSGTIKNTFLTAKCLGCNAETQPRHSAVANGFWRFIVIEIFDIPGKKLAPVPHLVLNLGFSVCSTACLRGEILT